MNDTTPEPMNLPDFIAAFERARYHNSDCIERARYHNSDCIERATFGRYRVSIIQDESAENLFENWDCEPPIYVYAGRRDGSHGFGEFEHGVDLPALTHEQIAASWRDLFRELSIAATWRDLRRYIAEYVADYPETGAVDAFNERLREDVADMGESDKLDAYAAVFRAAGVPADTFDVNGCSQGDWARVLVVLTPDWQKLTGCLADNAEACESNLKGAAKLYEAWAFGDVVGYRIERATDADEDCDDWEELDSCWGFYGHSNSDRANPDYSGVYEAALDVLTYHLETEPALCAVGHP